MSEATPPLSVDAFAAEYAKLLRSHLDSLGASANQTAPDPAEPTLNALMAEFMEYAVKRYNGARSSECWDFAGVFRVLGETHGDLPAHNFGPRAFQEARTAMIRAGWSRRYINEQCQRVKRFIAWGVANERLPRDARHALDAVPGLRRGEFGLDDPPPVRPVPDKTIDKTIAKLTPVVGDMVRVARVTGMRPGEVVQLAAKYVDRSGPVWLFTPPQHKTLHKGKGRTVAIGPRAQSILASYLDHADGGVCFRPVDSDRQRRAAQHAERKTPLHHGNTLATNRRACPKLRPGLCYTAESFRKAIHWGCDKAFPPPKGMKGAELKAWRQQHRWNPNQLRHSFATEVRQEFGIEAAQALLGHATLDMTEVYAEKNLILAAQAAAKIG